MYTGCRIFLKNYGPARVAQPSSRDKGHVTPASRLSHGWNAYTDCMHALQCLYLRAEGSRTSPNEHRSPSDHTLSADFGSIRREIWDISGACDTSCYLWAFRYAHGLIKTGEIRPPACGRICLIFMFARLGFHVKRTTWHVLVSPELMT
jgi:hypothetical protein